MVASRKQTTSTHRPAPWRWWWVQGSCTAQPRGGGRRWRGCTGCERLPLAANLDVGAKRVRFGMKLDALTCGDIDVDGALQDHANVW